MEIKELIAAIANHSGLPDAYAFLKRIWPEPHVAILIYHRVSPDQDNSSLVKPLTPQSFEKQIESFSRDYELLPLDKLAWYIQQGKALPKKAMVITVDDGYKDNYLYAYPILRKYHAPATIFLATGHIGTGKLFWPDRVKYIIQASSSTEVKLDKLGEHRLQSPSDKAKAALMIANRLKRIPEAEKNFLIGRLSSILGVDIPEDLGKRLILSWDEVREMSSHGIAFGAHTVNHPILTRLPLEQAKREIVQSKKDIEEKLRQPVTAFAYPNGRPRDFNSHIANLVKESGFTCAVNSIPRWVTPKANLYELNRIGVSRDINRFEVSFSGLYGDLRLYHLLQ